MCTSTAIDVADFRFKSQTKAADRRFARLEHSDAVQDSSRIAGNCAEQTVSATSSRLMPGFPLICALQQTESGGAVAPRHRQNHRVRTRDACCLRPDAGQAAVPVRLLAARTGDASARGHNCARQVHKNHGPQLLFLNSRSRSVARLRLLRFLALFVSSLRVVPFKLPNSQRMK